VFCTEPIFASLANVLGSRTNISDIPKDLVSYELHEVEVKYGLMQVCSIAKLMLQLFVL